MHVRFVFPIVFSTIACLLPFHRKAGAQSFSEKFGHVIDLNNLDNYANQPIPAYITRDNTVGNPITDEGATLGRILFYDKELSVDRTVSCASCHKQELAFADDLVQSVGVDGVTGRHSMRLINARFSQDPRFFWDERAPTLEAQTTQPIQDHIEMGFSGTGGDPSLDDLIVRMSELEYYQDLFTLVYGDPVITESRMQNALAQFVRSIQSFDSKFDEGRAQVPNNRVAFPNFTAEENQGKQLYRTRPTFDGNDRIGGGVGCNACHRMPEFDIAPNSNNNGVIENASGVGTDLTNVRSPSLRDVFSPAGGLNTQMMHNGLFTTMDDVLTHYNSPPLNPNLDNRLQRPGGNQRNLNLTAAERSALIAFMQTLTGSNVYVDSKWSDPFIDPPPAVEDFIVDDGLSASRSVVMGITVMFNVEVSAPASAFQLTNTTTSVPVTSIQTTAAVVEGKSMVTLTFDPGDSVVTRSNGNTLDDGVYMLEVIASEVTGVSTGDPMTANVTIGGIDDGLFRYYGDCNGDALCNFTDFAEHFNPAFGSVNGDPAFRNDLDFDGDDVVNFADFNLGFLPNFGGGL